MKRKITMWGSVWAVALIVLLAFTVTGNAQTYKYPEALKITTPALGSNSYNLALAWANKLDEATGMKVRLLPEESTSAKWVLTKNGKFDMMQDTLGYIANWMVEARSGFASQQGGPFPIRFVWQNQLMTFCVFVRGDSPVKTMADLAKVGKDFRIVHWTVPGGMEIVEAMLAWVNKTPKDITLVDTGSYPGSVRMVAEGKADLAAFGIPAAPVFMEASANPHGLRILDLDPGQDPEGAKRFKKFLPSYTFPKNMSGPAEFQGKTGWGTAGGFISNANLNADLVYNMVKWSMANFDALVAANPQLKVFMSLEANKLTIDTIYLPIHEGTVRFLKEKGMWSEANQKRQDYNIKVIDMYIKGYKDAIAKAASQKLTVDPNDPKWTDLWENYKKEKGIPRLEVLTDAEIAARLAKM